MFKNKDITDQVVEFLSGKMCPLECLEQYLKKIILFQPKLNCFVQLETQAATKAASSSKKRYQLGSPLSAIDGIPIALKDNINVCGMETRNGTKSSFPFTKDADITKRLKNAGAIILGKLNMDECAFGATTNNPNFGPTQNPWKIGYTAGGSSGGVASAVSAGLIMAGIGTDTLGSVRLPAAYCGLVGFKPTQGLVSTKGVIPLSSSLDHIGPLCLSVRDTKLLLNVLTNARSQPFRKPSQILQNLSHVSFGILAQTNDSQVTSEVAAGFARAKKDLINNGARIQVIKRPNFKLEKLRHHALLILELEGSKVLSPYLRNQPNLFSDALKKALEFGENAPIKKIKSAQNTLNKTREMIEVIFNEVDILISPTAPQNAFSFEERPLSNQAQFTTIANVTGCPAITLPTGLDLSGTPSAIQLIGPRHQEESVLKIAAFLEALWGNYRPPIDLPG